MISCITNMQLYSLCLSILFRTFICMHTCFTLYHCALHVHQKQPLYHIQIRSMNDMYGSFLTHACEGLLNN